MSRLLICALMFSWMGWNSAAFAAKAELKVGAAAPDFTAQGQDGKT
jgi:hypothetical protein